LFLALVRCLLLASAFAAAAASAQVPGLRLPRTVTPLHYDVQLRIDPNQEAFSGSVDIRVRVEEPVDVVWINAKGLAIGEVAATVIGGESLSGTRVAGSDDVVGVALSKPLPAGETLLSLRFTGALNSKSGTGAFRQEDQGRWYAFTQFQPEDARRAFPCFDEPDRKATWQLTLTVPAGLRVFSNTPVAAERASEPRWREVTFQRTPPLPSYLVAFAVGDFDVVDAGRVGMNATPISIVVPKGRAAEARYAANATGPILAAAERYFGAPYPFAKLDLIAIPTTTFGGAMENPGLVTYASRILLARPDEISPLFERRFVGFTAHEIAHMWFGNYVTMAWWDDLWLNEAFASWFGSKLVREIYPQWPQGRRSFQRSRAIELDRLATARRLREPVVHQRDIRAAFDATTYAKGETVLGMFEQWLGAEEFREGVRRYMAKHAWSNATADDFFAALGARDPSVLASFRGFADRAGVPLLDVALDCKGAPAVILAQQRLQPPGSPASEDAKRVFPVCLEYGDAKTGRQLCVVVGEAKQTVPLPTKSCPQWVIANRTGIGYYLPRLTPALYDALPKEGRPLPGSDYEPLLGDLAVLARAGSVRVDVALRVAARHAKSADASTARRAYAIAEGAGAAAVEPANRARYAAWIRHHFGDRARELGWLPRKGEAAEVHFLREVALPTVAVAGQDAALARKAQQLALRWVEHRSAIPPQARRLVLVAAARTSGKDAPRLFDALYEIARSSKDGNEREDVLAALGAFADPALADRALSLLLVKDARARQALPAIWEALGAEETRATALAWIASRKDAVMANVPLEQREWLPRAARDACTPRERALFVAAFENHLVNAEGERAYRQSLERIDQCLAVRKEQQASLTALLKR
jgi:alanyl aminopeptidase